MISSFFLKRDFILIHLLFALLSTPLNYIIILAFLAKSWFE